MPQADTGTYRFNARTFELRRSPRVPAAYPARVFNKRGKLLARGRTADISERGVFLLASGPGRLRAEQEIIVELRVPAGGQVRQRRQACRTVRYLSRIVRHETVGQHEGVGIEFLEKLG